MSNQWFVHDGTQQKGPFSESTIAEMASAGMFNQRTLLWTEGMATWVPFQESPFFTKPIQPQLFCFSWKRPNTQTTVERHVTGTDLPTTTEIKRTPVLLTILFTVITGGIYYPAWFLTRRQAINSLHSKEKLGSGVFVFGIVMCSLSIFLMMISGFFEGLNEATHNAELLAISEGIDAIDKILEFVVGITLLVQCYKVRRILRAHFNEYLGHNILPRALNS